MFIPKLSSRSLWILFQIRALSAVQLLITKFSPRSSWIYSKSALHLRPKLVLFWRRLCRQLDGLVQRIPLGSISPYWMLWRFQNFATFAGRKKLIPREAGTLWWIGYAIPTLLSRPQTAREHRISWPKVIKNSKAPPPRHNSEANDNNFTERQLNSVRRMIQESVAIASRDIATEAAMATVQALRSTNPATNGISPTSRGITPQNNEEQLEVCLNASPFQEIPASYVKDLQSGEFFNRQSCYLIL